MVVSNRSNFPATRPDPLTLAPSLPLCTCAKYACDRNLATDKTPQHFFQFVVLRNMACNGDGGVQAVNGAGSMNGGSPRKRARTEPLNRVTVVLGAQWGDEGKGKVVDMLATEVDVVCRCQVSCVSRRGLNGTLPPSTTTVRVM